MASATVLVAVWHRGSVAGAARRSRRLFQFPVQFRRDRAGPEANLCTARTSTRRLVLFNESDPSRLVHPDPVPVPVPDVEGRTRHRGPQSGSVILTDRRGCLLPWGGVTKISIRDKGRYKHRILVPEQLDPVWLFGSSVTNNKV